MSKNSKNKLCVLPWNHLYATNTGTIFPCCGSHYSLGQAAKDGWTQHIEDSEIVKKISTFPNMKALREQLANGEEPEICSGCFDKEKEGIWSYRQTANELFPETYSELCEDKLNIGSQLKLEFLDLRLGNRCNLACRMCNASSSHMLLEDFRDFLGDANYGSELEDLDWVSNRHLYRDIVEHCENLKIINMAGGEPFIIDESWEFLEMLIEKGLSQNIELRYNTNLTVLPEKAKAIWKKFKRVVLFLSIDGTEDVYEYIRYPGKWDRIYKNLKKLDLEFDEFNMESAKIQMTVQAYNIGNIPEITKLLQEFKRIEKVPILNILDHPTALNFLSLPLDSRDLVAKKLKLFLMDIFDFEGLKEVNTYEDFLRKVTYLIENLVDKKNYSKERNDEFNKLTDFFDNKRKQQLKKTFFSV